MKKYFYHLQYVYTDSYNDNHYFLIGYFSTLNKTKEAIKSVEDKPGFSNSGGSFEITKFCVNFDENIYEKSGIILYEASHEYLDNNEYDNVTIFGVYSTYEEAHKIQQENFAKYPYKDFTSGFCIAECKVDLIGWREGFLSW